MRHLLPALALATLLPLLAQAQLAAPDPNALPSKVSPDAQWWRDAQATKDTRLAWWRNARFGMFIHWGVYSSLGNTYNGRKGGGYAEHIQRVLKIPIPEYHEKVAGSFNPTLFNADQWVRAAKSAGMGYLVITAKHHDGFAMFPSKASPWNVVDATPWHHDPMKDLKEACTRYGLKFGFYYSHAFDWGEPDAPGNDWDYQNPGGDRHLYESSPLHAGVERSGTPRSAAPDSPRINWWDTPEGAAFLPRVRHYVDSKVLPQLKELVDHYHPDILWFDTPHKLPPGENYRILKTVREYAPNVVINGRLLRAGQSGNWGDYDSTTDRPAEFPPHDGDREGIPTTNESYGYNPLDTSHKPPAHFIQLLAKAAARGGNLLMNIGPKGDGSFDTPDTQILDGIAQWMKPNQPSIQGTTKTPLPVQPWGESTKKGNKLYLHIFRYPTDGKLEVGGLESSPTNCYLLADPSQTRLASSRNTPLTLTIDLPRSFTPDPADTVLVLEFPTDNIETDPALPISTTTPTTLRAFDAHLNGKGLSFGPGKKTDSYITNWKSADQSVTWPIRVNKRTLFDVTLNYNADAPATVVIRAGNWSKEVVIVSGKGAAAHLNGIPLDPDSSEIAIIPKTTTPGSNVMQLISLHLNPVTE